jgi:hypothetical protein
LCRILDAAQCNETAASGDGLRQAAAEGWYRYRYTLHTSYLSSTAHYFKMEARSAAKFSRGIDWKPVSTKRPSWQSRPQIQIRRDRRPKLKPPVFKTLLPKRQRRRRHGAGKASRAEAASLSAIEDRERCGCRRGGGGGGSPPPTWLPTGTANQPVPVCFQLQIR